MPFETFFKPENFRFENYKVEIFEDAAGIKPPTTILQSDQNFYVRVSWENWGKATGMICGEWHLVLFAESVGPGDDYLLYDSADAHIEPLTPGSEPVKYSYDIDVKKGTLPVVGAHGVTLYNLYVSLTYFDATHRRGPIAVNDKDTTIQIYDEGVYP